MQQALRLLQLTALGHFPGYITGRNPGRAGRLLKWEDGPESPRETQVARALRTEYWRGESCLERELHRSMDGPLECSPEYSSVPMRQEPTWAQGKNHLKRIRGDNARCSYSVGIVPIPTNQLGKPQIHRCQAEYLISPWDLALRRKPYFITSN